MFCKCKKHITCKAIPVLAVHFVYLKDTVDSWIDRSFIFSVLEQLSIEMAVGN